MQFDLAHYCPPNQTLTPHFWPQNGISPCLIETVISTFSVTFMMVFGTMQIVLYNRYSTPVLHYILPSSQLYGLQVVLNGTIPFLCLLELFIELFVFKPGIMYGYMIWEILQAAIAWPIALLLLRWERNFMLPTPPSRGHGIILLFFWTGMFSMENLMLLNFKSKLWFFMLKDFQDAVRFSLFLARYLGTGIIFVLGLKAPGVLTPRHSDSFARFNIEFEC